MSLPTLPLPDFAFDTDTNYGVIAVGRLIAEGQLSPPSRVKAVQDAVDEWATRTGLPLAYVHMGTTINWDLEEDDDDSECSTGLVGLVTAYIDGLGGDAHPIAVEASALDPALYDRIPAELWTDLETRLGVKFGRYADNDDDSDDDDSDDSDSDDSDSEDEDSDASDDSDSEDERDEPGVYLAPAGWTVASLYLASAAELDEDGRPGGTPAVSVAAEDTVVGKRLDTAERAHLRTAAGGLLLYATYC